MYKRCKAVCSKYFAGRPALMFGDWSWRFRTRGSGSSCRVPGGGWHLGGGESERVPAECPCWGPELSMSMTCFFFFLMFELTLGKTSTEKANSGKGPKGGRACLLCYPDTHPAPAPSCLGGRVTTPSLPASRCLQSWSCLCLDPCRLGVGEDLCGQEDGWQPLTG